MLSQTSTIMPKSKKTVRLQYSNRYLKDGKVWNECEVCFDGKRPQRSNHRQGI